MDAKHRYLHKKMANSINAFEKKILRRIYGSKNENGVWRARYNFELYQQYKDQSISEYDSRDSVERDMLSGWKNTELQGECSNRGWRDADRKTQEMRG